MAGVSGAEREPLGSLTQRGARGERSCRACSSVRVTHIVMELTDGSLVDFTSCLDCEERTWEQDGEVLTVDTVLHKTRRPDR
ncbi:MAG: hypothetical protein EPO13_07910 [Actinomycetota bacterium]|nr:MAG: hypothetical protein EPO13_07910 [Actinomycetota bacterium]